MESNIQQGCVSVMVRFVHTFGHTDFGHTLMSSAVLIKSFIRKKSQMGNAGIKKKKSGQVSVKHEMVVDFQAPGVLIQQFANSSYCLLITAGHFIRFDSHQSQRA